MDAAFSLELAEMAQFVRECNTACEALGEVSYDIQEQEKKSVLFRRSLYIVEDMKPGDIITDKNMRSIRLGLGLSSKYYEGLLGRKIRRNIAKATALNWDFEDL